MMAKTTTTEKPMSTTDQLLQKREEMMSERDSLLGRLMELNSGIESIDSVITMFDPNHVPLDIRNAARTAPMLMLQAQPLLTEHQTSSSAASGKSEASVSEAPSKSESRPVETPAKNAKVKKSATKAAKPKSKTVSAKSAGAPSSDKKQEEAASPLAQAISKRAQQTAKTSDDKPKRNSDARQKISEYFQPIDKLATLEMIVSSSKDGIPLREIVERFVEAHPIDISDQEVKKVFRDRLSTLLYTMSQQSIVARTERVGDDGNKENVWTFTKGNARNREDRDAPEASAAV